MSYLACWGIPVPPAGSLPPPVENNTRNVQDIRGLNNPSAVKVALIIAAIVVAGALLGAAIGTAVVVSGGGFAAVLIPAGLALIAYSAAGGAVGAGIGCGLVAIGGRIHSCMMKRDLPTEPKTPPTSQEMDDVKTDTPPATPPATPPPAPSQNDEPMDLLAPSIPVGGSPQSDKSSESQESEDLNLSRSDADSDHSGEIEEDTNSDDDGYEYLECEDDNELIFRLIETNAEIDRFLRTTAESETKKDMTNNYPEIDELVDIVQEAQIPVTQDELIAYRADIGLQDNDWNNLMKDYKDKQNKLSELIYSTLTQSPHGEEKVKKLEEVKRLEERAANAGRGADFVQALSSGWGDVDEDSLKLKNMLLKIFDPQPNGQGEPVKFKSWKLVEGQEKTFEIELEEEIKGQLIVEVTIPKKFSFKLTTFDDAKTVEYIEGGPSTAAGEVERISLKDNKIKVGFKAPKSPTSIWDVSGHARVAAAAVRDSVPTEASYNFVFNQTNDLKW